MPSFSFVPYKYISSKVIAAAAAGVSATQSSSSSIQPPSYFGNIVLQFNQQVMRPKVILPLFVVIFILFDLDDALELDQLTEQEEEDDTLINNDFND